VVASPRHTCEPFEIHPTPVSYPFLFASLHPQAEFRQKEIAQLEREERVRREQAEKDAKERREKALAARAEREKNEAKVGQSRSCLLAPLKTSG
jgi:hypothetical protein